MSLRLPVTVAQVLRSAALPRSLTLRQSRPGQLHDRFFSSILPCSGKGQPAPVLGRIPTAVPLARATIAPSTSTSTTTTRSGSRSAGSFLRSFSTSRSHSIRSTYFPRNNGSGGGVGGGPRRPGFFRRLFITIDNLPSMYIIYGLLAANISIYLLWEYARTSYQRFRDPSLYQFMVRNFLINEMNIQAGRLWTFVTSCFSHSSGSHILVNCLGLYFMAPAAAQLLGNVRFLGFYLVGGVVSTMTSILWRRARGDKMTSSEGASGAIYSCMSFFAAMFPTTQFLLFFVIPMPAWTVVGGIFAWDLFGAVFRPHSTTDSAGHLGGIVAGLGAAMLFRRGRLPRGPRLR